jgi:hypothetical protein
VPTKAAETDALTVGGEPLAKLLLDLGRYRFEAHPVFVQGLLCLHRWVTISICFVQPARSALLTVNDRELLIVMLRTRPQFDRAVTMVALLHRFLAYADALT